MIKEMPEIYRMFTSFVDERIHVLSWFTGLIYDALFFFLVLNTKFNMLYELYTNEK